MDLSFKNIDTFWTITGEFFNPVKWVEMQSFTIASGVLSHTRTNIITGQLLGRIIVGLTTNQALNGVYTKSPFRFSPWDLNRINLVVNGKSIPTRPFTPNFKSGEGIGVQYARCFSALSTVCGGHNTNYGNGITRKAYADGYTLFAFALSEDWSNTSFGLLREGNVQLEIAFAGATPHVLNAVVYLQYENTLSIEEKKHRCNVADIHLS